MLRALRLIDDDDACEHIINTSKLTEAQLSKVVKVDGVPWLATEVGLLKEFPDDKRTPFRKLAKKRGKKQPIGLSRIKLPRVYPRPEASRNRPKQRRHKRSRQRRSKRNSWPMAFPSKSKQTLEPKKRHAR